MFKIYSIWLEKNVLFITWTIEPIEQTIKHLQCGIYKLYIIWNKYKKNEAFWAFPLHRVALTYSDFWSLGRMLSFTENDEAFENRVVKCWDCLKNRHSFRSCTNPQGSRFCFICETVHNVVVRKTVELFLRNLEPGQLQ